MLDAGCGVESSPTLTRGQEEKLEPQQTAELARKLRDSLLKQVDDISRLQAKDGEDINDPWVIYRRLEPLVKESPGLDLVLRKIARTASENDGKQLNERERLMIEVGDILF